ncbi:unnamed protein product, partial [Phaeothamnion confervicola]
GGTEPSPRSVVIKEVAREVYSYGMRNLSWTWAAPSANYTRMPGLMQSIAGDKTHELYRRVVDAGISANVTMAFTVLLLYFDKDAASALRTKFVSTNARELLDALLSASAEGRQAVMKEILLRLAGLADDESMFDVFKAESIAEQVDEAPAEGGGNVFGLKRLVRAALARAGRSAGGTALVKASDPEAQALLKLFVPLRQAVWSLFFRVAGEPEFLPSPSGDLLEPILAALDAKDGAAREVALQSATLRLLPRDAATIADAETFCKNFFVSTNKHFGSFCSMDLKTVESVEMQLIVMTSMDVVRFIC